jgi:predicted component of type VI protein secretion system
MLRLRRAAVVIPGLLLALSAQADDEPATLDSVDTGHTRSLDSVDTGKMRTFGSVDDGETVDQDTLDKGHTTSLDAADTGHTVDQDALDTGTTESLSAAETAPEAPPALPAPLPMIADDSLREEAQTKRDALVEAEHRVVAANAEYSEMRAHDFPRGEAAAAIVKEHEDANAAYEAANASYRAILEQVDPAAIGD